MPSIGPMEIVAVAAIALIVFGPDKLPEIARTVGRTLSQLRRMADDVRDEFKEGLDFSINDDDDEDEDEDASGPAPRRDHPNVLATEAASTAKPAWDQAQGEDDGPEEEFDPNYDVEPSGTTPGGRDGEAETPETPAPEEPADKVGSQTPSEPEASGTGPPEAQTEGDRPPEHRAG